MTGDLNTDDDLDIEEIKYHVSRVTIIGEPARDCKWCRRAAQLRVFAEYGPVDADGWPK